MRTIQKIITKVDGSRGAPMGRPNVGERPHTITSGPHCRIFKCNQVKIFDCKVPMCSCCGAYDTGGAYWGSNRMGDIGVLRVSYTKDLSYVCFYREGSEQW